MGMRAPGSGRASLRSSASAAPGRSAPRARAGNQAFALGPLAGKLASAANGLALLAHSLFRWLFVSAAAFHLAKHTLALELLLQGPKGLVNVVVSDDDKQGTSPFTFDEMT